MKLKEFAHFLKTAVVDGAEKTLTVSGGVPGSFTKAEAYRSYGRGNIDRWLQEGLIQITNKHFDRNELEQVAAASNRITYLSTEERKNR